MTIDKALEIYSKPKERRRGLANLEVKELGVDPTTEKPLVIEDGRFVRYLTGG